MSDKLSLQCANCKSSEYLYLDTSAAFNAKCAKCGPSYPIERIWPLDESLAKPLNIIKNAIDQRGPADD